MRKMEIVYFVWEWKGHHIGGLGTYSINIVPEILKLGHGVSVFTYNPGNLPTKEIATSSPALEVHRPLTVDTRDSWNAFLPPELKEWNKNDKFLNNVLVSNTLWACKLKNDLISKGRKYDIIVGHDWLSAPASMAAKRETGLPFVFHLHSTEVGRTGGGNHHIQSLEISAAQMADMVITVSHPMRDNLIHQGFPSEKIRVCWNGIDPEKYNPKRVSFSDIQRLRQSYDIGESDIMVFFIGRLDWVKGVVELVQAMPMVSSKYPKVKLVIVGRGDLQRTIEDLISRMGLQKNVKTKFEFISEEERILHYAACDIAVFPSKYEPFGIVALEAMAMAKPVVVGANGLSGFKEIVIPFGPEQTGMHVNGNIPADIAECGINPLLKDMERAREMGKKGRERVEKDFTWQKVARETVKFYEEAIKK